MISQELYEQAEAELRRRCVIADAEYHRVQRPARAIRERAQSAAYKDFHRVYFPWEIQQQQARIDAFCVKCTRHCTGGAKRIPCLAAKPLFEARQYWIDKMEDLKKNEKATTRRIIPQL